MKRVTEKISISLTPYVLDEIDKRDVGRGRSETISRIVRRYAMLVSRSNQQEALADAVEADQQDQRAAKEEGQENE